MTLQKQQALFKIILNTIYNIFIAAHENNNHLKYNPVVVQLGTHRVCINVFRNF